jgi:hypothetical protein
MNQVTFDVCSIGPVEPFNLWTIHVSDADLMRTLEALALLSKDVHMVEALSTTAPN